MAKKKSPAPRRAGTRRTKASQVRLDAILNTIGNDPSALLKLIAALAGTPPQGVHRAQCHQLVVDISTVS